MDYERFILNNGLRLIIHKDKTSTVAAINLLYDVGARDEHPDKTGFAHLFEHLMFGGSENIPDFDGVLQRAGGENNAFTNNDITNYYITIPTINLETAFYLESDRMLKPAFSQKSIDVQKGVVVEEYKQSYLNRPYGDVSLKLRPLAYKKHPYKWSTIGKSIKHIENAQMEDVKEFFYKYYAPNNAVLIVAGNVDTKRVLDLTNKWFGDIPRRDVPLRNLPVEPKQIKKRTLTIHRNVPSDAIYMAYHMCGRNNDEYYATDLISDILSNGKSSRFNRKIIKKKRIFSELDAYIQGAHHPGLFMITGKLYPTVNVEKAENTIKKELALIVEGDFTNRELQKVKNRVIAVRNFSKTDILNKAIELAYFEWLGDVSKINEIDELYQAVSKNDIERIAKKLFAESNLSCLYCKAK